MRTRRANFVGRGSRRGDGPPLQSHNPATGEIVFDCRCADAGLVADATACARRALEGWQNVPFEKRAAILGNFAERLRHRRQARSFTISSETGKPTWEALTEVDAMIAKVAISIDAWHERRRPTERQQGGATATTDYKPLGVMAVFGPFNMPGHLPNGHIVPALLAGNTVVFKPSELAPFVGAQLALDLKISGLPDGVLNLVQGGREIGTVLATDRNIDGVLFTGSMAGGLAINRALADQPNKIVALEMGGNNPLVVWNPKDIGAAAYLTIQSAYITSGQRCSCARRLIVSNTSTGRAFIDRLVSMIRGIQVGPFTQSPEPFMGPVISDDAADRLLQAQKQMIADGATPLVEMRIVGSRRAMLSPGLIDVGPQKTHNDIELFGPLLQLSWADDFDDAIAKANATAYGLAAGLFTDDAELWRRFYRKIRAGVVYWNRQTTGGSSYLPFGGVGLSGNFRPSGYWAADYCSYPVASMQTPTLAMPAQKTPGVG